MEQVVGKLLKNRLKDNMISLIPGDSMKTNEQTDHVGIVRGEPLVWLRMEGLLILILNIFLYALSGASWWLFALLLLTPDLAMAGYWLSARSGAVTYNVAHSYVGPVVMAGAALASSHAALLPYCSIWAAHIGMDRALGYGLKYPESFKSTHLCWLGHERAA
jgi:hypothetical protein